MLIEWQNQVAGKIPLLTERSRITLGYLSTLLLTILWWPSSFLRLPLNLVTNPGRRESCQSWYSIPLATVIGPRGSHMSRAGSIRELPWDFSIGAERSPVEMLEGRKPGAMLDSDSAIAMSVTHPEKPPTWSTSRCGMFPSSGSQIIFREPCWDPPNKGGHLPSSPVTLKPSHTLAPWE